MSEVTLYLADEEAMTAFGARIAQTTEGHGLIFFSREIWAPGKPRCPEALFVAWGIQAR